MTVVNYSDFGDSENKKYVVMIAVNQACYRGTMISHLSGENRILITAADSTHDSWTMAAFYGEDLGTHFAHGFILTMGTMDNPTSARYAYDHGVDATNNNNYSPPSYPEI